MPKPLRRHDGFFFARTFFFPLLPCSCTLSSFHFGVHFLFSTFVFTFCVHFVCSLCVFTFRVHLVCLPFVFTLCVRFSCSLRGFTFVFTFLCVHFCVHFSCSLLCSLPFASTSFVFTFRVASCVFTFLPAGFGLFGARRSSVFLGRLPPTFWLGSIFFVRLSTLVQVFLG